MAERTRDIWNDDDGEKTPRKHPVLRGLLVFFLTLIVVLGIVLVAAYRDGTGFDTLRRYFSYGSTETVSGETVFRYDASSGNRYAVLGNRLVVLSETKLSLLDPGGGEVWSTQVSMTAPALQGNGSRAVAYDVGGTALYVVDQKGELLHLQTEDEEPLIAASLNRDGWLAVTEEKDNYKAWVTVYDEELEKVFAFKSSERFVTDARVTDDNDHLAVVTLGQTDSVFTSNVVLYNLKKEDPVADYGIEDGLVVAMGQQGDLLATVSDTCLTLAGLDGTVTAEYRYGEDYLRGYALEGDDFAALLLNRYQSGSAGRLVTIGADGAELATLDVNQEVLGISAAGRYLAVLYADKLVIYNPELQAYASLTGTDFASGVLMRPDGSALLLSSEYAGLFLP